MNMKKRCLLIHDFLRDLCFSIKNFFCKTRINSNVVPDKEYKSESRIVETSEEKMESLGTQVDYLKLCKRLAEIVKQNDMMAKQMPEGESKDLLDDFSEQIISSMVLGGCKAITHEKTFNSLRHRPVPFSIVEDGTPIEKTERVGVELNEIVLIPSLVKCYDMKLLVEGVKDKLKECLPNVMRIVGDIQKKLDKKIEEYIKLLYSVDGNTIISRPNSIFLYVIGAMRGDQYCISLLSYIDKEINSLYELVKDNNSHVSKIKNKIKNMLCFYDNETDFSKVNPDFLNTLSELLYAAYFIPASSQKYNFVGFDVKMDNQKDSDIVFKRVLDGNSIYIDNLSIHYIDLNKAETNDDLRCFLKKRIKEKLDNKTQDLLKDGEFFKINGDNSEFYVAPFIWCETSDLKNFIEVFKEFDTSGSLNHMFLALCPIKQSDGSYLFEIQIVSKILEKWNQQNNTKEI